MAVLYRHIRLDKNEPFYIGIGKDEKRAYSKQSRNTYWRGIVKKTDYEVEILFDNLTWDEACEKEKEFIKLYGRKDIGTGCLCNMTDGGDGTINISNETRSKMIESHTGKSLSEVTKDKISEKVRGENHPMYGKVHTDESKEKMSNSKKGKPSWNKGKKGIMKGFSGTHTDESKEKMRQKKLGRKLPEETKEKMRKSHQMRLSLKAENA